jgi:hypothetical protein
MLARERIAVKLVWKILAKLVEKIVDSHHLWLPFRPASH